MRVRGDGQRPARRCAPFLPKNFLEDFALTALVLESWDNIPYLTTTPLGRSKKTSRAARSSRNLTVLSGLPLLMVAWRAAALAALEALYPTRLAEVCAWPRTCDARIALRLGRLEDRCCARGACSARGVPREVGGSEARVRARRAGTMSGCWLIAWTQRRMRAQGAKSC